MPRAHAEDQGLVFPLQRPDRVLLCLVALVLVRPLPSEAATEEGLGFLVCGRGVGLGESAAFLCKAVCTLVS